MTDSTIVQYKIFNQLAGSALTFRINKSWRDYTIISLPQKPLIFFSVCAYCHCGQLLWQHSSSFSPFLFSVFIHSFFHSLYNAVNVLIRERIVKRYGNDVLIQVFRYRAQALSVTKRLIIGVIVDGYVMNL